MPFIFPYKNHLGLRFLISSFDMVPVMQVISTIFLFPILNFNDLNDNTSTAQVPYWYREIMMSPNGRRKHNLRRMLIENEP